jgi:hypothetical protein
LPWLKKPLNLRFGSLLIPAISSSDPMPCMLPDAVRSAIRHVQAAGCHVIRCEIDERQLSAY